ncbi:DUF4136 domain-containing protein [Hahella aquimaris]|uniref:DUF4136 domain-containing protein n=1 Tax=Hahella sp. HNIBRBA332 TaxID=3015983 RepID=UPI00273C6901|nr:DUF4136 domain-containing protein [Hahella sp. HNIBRBA332]WLQ17127.1 DUF4136 domain-containing protein [Hahella sp. HNIBRBA332]
MFHKRIIGGVSAILVTLTLTTNLSGCATKAARYDYQPGRDFSSLKTYALTPPSVNGGATTLSDARIENAIRLFMQNKGFQMVDKVKADVWSTWRIKEEKEIRRDGISYGFGYGIASGRTGVGISLGTRPPAEEVMRGKLVLEMIDPQNANVIWSAEAARPLSEDDSPAAKEAEIRKQVGEMLQNFPPKDV